MLKSVWMVSALVVTLWGASALAADRPAGKELPGQTIEIKLEPQAWQTRRAETANVIGAIEASKGKNKAAMDRFDAILTAFEKDPVSITPMEAMDLYAVFYVPNESDKNMAGVLQMVSAFAVLGWYDSLRFADESGRAEIINNERFFNRAFTISGEATTKKLMDFLHKHPKEAEEAVSAGTRLAAAISDKISYDVHWPTAYGLGRLSCGLEGAKTCPPPPAMPKDKWKDSFAEAAAQVAHYYRDNGRK